MKKILIFSFIVFFGCATKPEPLPNWVIHTKNNPEYWQSVGTGLSREIAVKQATNSIASQISVQIESNIKTIKAERNFEMEEFSQSIIESRVNISLPEVEIEEIIQSNNIWYARASLNKNKYYQLLEQKRQNAKDASLNLLIASKKINKLEQIQSIYKAYEEIKTYLDIPLYVQLNGQDVNLYSEIVSNFQKAVQSIKIVPETENIQLKSVLPIHRKVDIQVISEDNKSTDGLLFSIKFNSGKTNSNLSSSNNVIHLIIDEVYPKNPSDVISIQLDLNSILNTDNTPSSFNISKTKEINIEILPLNIFVESNELNLGEKLNPLQIYPIISQHFINNYSANLVDNSSFCDIKVNAHVSTEKGNNGENEWGIFKTFADFKISILACNSNQELFNFSEDQVQGGDFESHKNAGSQAINNLATQLENKILPLLDKSLTQP